MSRKRGPTIVSHKIYFDWQELDGYRTIADIHGLDLTKAMYFFIREGFAQLIDRALAQPTAEEQEVTKHPDKTPEQVQATQEATDYEQTN